MNIDELQAEGHRIIETIVLLGVLRKDVYKSMAGRMEMSHRACHFSRVHDIPTLQRMIFCLHAIHADRIRKLTNKANRDMYKKMCTDRELLREVGRRNSARYPRNIPIWRRALSRIRAILPL